MNRLFRNIYGLAGLAVIMIAGSSLLYNSTFIHDRLPIDLEAFTQILHEKEAHTIQLLKKLEQQSENRGMEWAFREHYPDYEGIFNKDGIILLGYRNDSLRFWTDNKAPVDHIKTPESFPGRFIRLQNGFYEVIHHPVGNHDFYGLILVKFHYAFENDYLVNAFAPDFGIHTRAQMAIEEGSDLPEIRSSEGIYLFSMKFSKNQETFTWRYYFVLFLFVGGVVLFLSVWLQLVRKLSNHIPSLVSVVFLIFALLALRFWSLWVGYPLVFSDLELFNPAWYGTSFLFPSLGDLLINAALFLFLAWVLNRYWEPKFSWNLRLQLLVGSVMISGVYFFAGFMTRLFNGLIKDSGINFEVNDLFGLDGYSYVGILVVGILFLTAFVLAHKTMLVLSSCGMKRSAFLALFFLITIAGVVIHHITGKKDLILVLWPAVLMLILASIHFRQGKNYEFTSVLLLLFLTSFASSHTLTRYSQKKEQENRKVFAEKLTSDEDPVAEWEFPPLERKLLSTNWLYEPFDTTVTFRKAAYEKRIKQTFFKGYWDKYEVGIHLYNADGSVVGQLPNSRPLSFQKVETLISLYGLRSDLSPNVFYIHNSGEKLSYLIRLPMKRNNKTEGYLVFELVSKLIPEELGFPALLLGKNSREIEDLSNYSSARYVNRKLIHFSGEYSYPLTLDVLESIQGEGPFFSFDGYSHLFFWADPNTLIILSKPDSQILGEITAFSYLFAFFGILMVLVIFIRSLPEGVRIDNLQLKTKIQFLLVSILLLSLILFVVGTRYYIEEQYKEKNNSIISEKVNSVQIEVANKLGDEPRLNKSLTDRMTKNLRKFAGVFFTDINLYNLDGNLLASSREKIFDEGMISRQIHPKAWLEIGMNKKSKFIHEEEIGGMVYLSAYVPFRNKNNQILAYLNLPYFARQDALENEISSFLVAIINIFVLLFAFSIVVALFASNWITKPLRLIQQSLARIELGKSNKPIDYKGNDEIGSLVAEYNRKVVELQKNAELLARSERESAWREMARQVAHEIKNPLTPIKLRAQHMQMSFNAGAEGAQDRILNFTDMLIEQIDTLTTIANEFSNFAQMPRAVEEKTDLVHVLESAVELHQGNNDAQVVYVSNLSAPQYIHADKDQVGRVFNNLIKNAIQAIPSNQEGRIRVLLTLDENGYQVEIQDNGSGISDDMIDKLFMPNFTTKSTGMGLGLAMVKQMIENHRGTVHFKTKKNVGTSFFVYLPIYTG